MLGFNSNRGDTLVEVLFASAVFSLIATGGLAIMNQGTTTIQRSYEMTMVRQEIDAQASTLRFLNSSYVAAFSPGSTSVSYSGPARKWYNMNSSISATNYFSNLSKTSCPEFSNLPPGSFILNTRNGDFLPLSDSVYKKSDTYSMVEYGISDNIISSKGLWIEAVKYDNILANQLTAQYTDFHIKSCWYGPGQSSPITLDTVVRLYAPK